MPRLLARLGDPDRAGERFRRLCLALPEAREMAAWGHPVFKAAAKTFAAHRTPFFATPYGRGLWVSAWADARLDWRLIGSLVERSFRTVAHKRMLTALDGGSR